MTEVEVAKAEVEEAPTTTKVELGVVPRSRERIDLRNGGGRGRKGKRVFGRRRSAFGVQVRERRDRPARWWPDTLTCNFSQKNMQFGYEVESRVYLLSHNLPRPLNEMS